MRNTYGAKYITINEPVRDKFRRLQFQRKLNEAADLGYEPVGRPKFYKDGDTVYGVILLYRV